MTKLEDVLGIKEKKLNLQGQLVKIHPIRVRDLPKFLEKRTLVIDLFKNGDIAGSLVKNFDEILELLCSVCSVERELVDNLELHELVELVEAIVELNKEGFFLIMQKVEKIGLDKIKKKAMNGATPSSSSSKKATTSKESRATQ